MPDALGAERRVRDPADGDDTAPRRQPIDEMKPRRHLRARRRMVRPLRPRVRRHDVPEQHVVADAELREDAVDDRRARLGRAGARQLALRGEREPRDARAAVPGRLADEQQARLPPRFEVRRQPPSEDTGAGSLAVEVEGAADLGAPELGDERSDAPIAAPSRETMTRSDSHTGGWTTS